MISQADYMELMAGAAGLAILGVVASVVRLARYGWKGFRHFIAGTIISVFVAVTTGFLLEFWDLPPTVQTGLVGWAAYMGGTLLDAALCRVDKEIRSARIPLAQEKGEE